MKNIIEIYDLNYLNIFNNFSIDFERNKITSISGPNNCGKTTLIRLLDKQINTLDEIVVNGIKIDDYKITEYNKIVKSIIPGEYTPIYETVEEEINYYIEQLFLSKEETNKRLRGIYKNLNLNKVKKQNISNLTTSEFICLQIAVAIASMPKIILIDDIAPFVECDDVKKIIDYFIEIKDKYDLTVIISSSRMEDILKTDYLYIISQSEVALEGNPYEIVKKDNVLNKLGIRLPFMIDLSIKLKDYNLIDTIETDMDRMINLLWK